MTSRSARSVTRRPHPETSVPAHRLGVVFEHLSGLLLSAHLLHALPFQVTLLSLLEDLVGAALPGPQELRRLSRPQQHSCRKKGVQSTCTHSEVECLRSGFWGTMMPMCLGCSGTVMSRAQRSGTRMPACQGYSTPGCRGRVQAWCPTPGGGGVWGPEWYSLWEDSEASRSSRSAVPRAAAGPGGGGMARPWPGSRAAGNVQSKHPGG